MLVTVALSFPLFSSGSAQEEPVYVPSEGLDNTTATMEVEGFGTIVFILYLNWTPITTSNFITLAEEGHYDGVLFHRIIDDFVIQTGDGGGSSSIELEYHPNATHIDGAVGMARSDDPDSASDQFYICDGAQHGLDASPDGSAGYAAFGVVIEGLDVVQAIAKTPVYGENSRPGIVIPTLWQNLGTPKEDVVVTSITIQHPNATTDVGEGNLSAVAGMGEGGDITLFLLVGLMFVGIGMVLFLRKRKLASVAEDTEQ